MAGKGVTSGRTPTKAVKTVSAGKNNKRMAQPAKPKTAVAKATKGVAKSSGPQRSVAAKKGGKY